MADITLPLGVKNINSRLYEAGAHTVKARQEVGDKQQEKKGKLSSSVVKKTFDVKEAEEVNLRVLEFPRIDEMRKLKTDV